MFRRTGRATRRTAARSALAAGAAALLAATLLPATAQAQAEPDPREGLAGGYRDAAEAAVNMERLATLPKPPGFENLANPGDFGFVNSDLAFTGDFAIMGGYHGFQVYDVSDPAEPTLRSSFICPGGQGDVSVYGDLLFVSVEENRGRLDCGTQGVTGNPNPDRFRGVRIFDISDIDNPVNLGGMQTCKGSHTHTLVPDAEDPDNLYVYISGTAGIRNGGEEPGGCTGASSLTNPNTDNFSISIYQVPLADPTAFELVNRNARVFSVCGDNSCQDQYASGALNGLLGSGVQPTYPADGPRAPGGQSRAQASQCHDITAYPEIGLAAGACQGWGLLMDISDPVNPKRIAAVEDYNFAYWHSATFNNDGTKVVFTDEWGGGTGARCAPTYNVNIGGGVIQARTTPESWGANALFDIVTDEAGNKSLEWASYYKIPNNQTAAENCVAHNGNLVPVPGRDIMVQAWYQGGVSVWDFTDTANPVELAFFDRGPLNPNQLVLSGYWSTYWNNGAIVGSEIARGFDTLALGESDGLNAIELEAAASVVTDEANPQNQERIEWPASFTTVRAWQSAANRQGALSPALDAEITKYVDRAERFSTGPQRTAAAATLRDLTGQLGDSGVEDGLEGAILDLADSL
jgi:hypothetical protein